MEFATFASRASDIEETSADLEIVNCVADVLRDAGDDLPVVARFVQGRIFPAWDGRTLDIGPAYCYEAIARGAGDVTADEVEERVASVGDVGTVAADLVTDAETGLTAYDRTGLSVGDVYAELERIAAASGPGSQESKIDGLAGLVRECSPTVARYLVRLALGEMRIGVGSGTVRDAIADAFLDDGGDGVDAVERALQVTNDHGRVATVARDDGRAGLDDLRMTVGRPVGAMLAQIGTVGDALDDWGSAGVEWKFDGARVQVHYGPPLPDDGRRRRDPDAAPDDAPFEVRVFSRNMEDVTDALPEVVEVAGSRLDAPTILDGEVVAVDDGRPQPFQQVLRRFRRKYDVEETRDEVALEWYAFDCLHHDGEDLLDAALTDRRERLVDALGVADRAEGADDRAGIVPFDGGGVSALAVLDDAASIEAVEAAALDAGHEGLLLKNPSSAYTPGRRGRNWLKRKPDVETLDLVVTGAEWGEGRRAELLGTFELSVRTGDGFATVGNVATGVTDEELAALTERFEPLVRAEDGHTVDLEPRIVFEVGYEEIQTSPATESGYALRFPRYVGLREDKGPADADTLDRLERLAAEQ